MLARAKSGGVYNRVHVLSPNNSGSSFAEHILDLNSMPFLDFPHRTDLFKHYPPDLIDSIINKSNSTFDNAIFVIVAREPCAWLRAMQINRYEFVFETLESPCSISLSAENYGIAYSSHLQKLGFGTNEIASYFEFENIIKYWSAYYLEALRFIEKYAGIIVTYEELLLRTPEFIYEAKSLLGLAAESSIVLPMLPSKTHGDAKGFLGARTSLLEQLSVDFSPTKALVKKHADAKVLTALGYDYEGFADLTGDEVGRRLASQNLFWTAAFRRMLRE